MSAILTDVFTTGFIAKTYYQKYKVFHGFKHYETKIIRTSRDFWEKNQKNLGMSLFRRSGKKSTIGTLPIPPGSLFVGNTSFGRWRTSDYGDKVWRFHRPYRNFPKEFGWINFDYTQRRYKSLKIHIDNNTPYYGRNNEFGTYGDVTREFLKLNYDDKIKSFSLVEHMKLLFSITKEIRRETQIR
ncbi:MAG: hypothetical protein KAG61_03730 [Bacteriovoracaceae bacterium]|nr:hypothetical protein [Bacteriovoracaceae bacterium]